MIPPLDSMAYFSSSSNSSASASSFVELDVKASGIVILHNKHVHFITLGKDNYMPWKSLSLGYLEWKWLVGLCWRECIAQRLPLAKMPRSTYTWLFACCVIALDSPAGDRTVNIGWSLVLFLRDRFLLVSKHAKSMVDYLFHVMMFCNRLLTINEVILEPELVLTIIGGLGVGYESMFTSMTTRFDRSMTFLDLEEILMDYDMTNLEEKSFPIFTHAIITTPQRSSENRFQSCQICGKKNPSALNRYNATKYSYNHKWNVVCLGVPIGGGVYKSGI